MDQPTSLRALTVARPLQTRVEPTLYHQIFRDHTGQPAVRLRLDTPIPEDFHENPVFSFQVYTTFLFAVVFQVTANKIILEAGQEMLPGVFTGVNGETKYLVAYLGGTLSQAQRTCPIWEIYGTEPNAIACVEHQRREIAHRYAHRQRCDSLRIPLVGQGGSGVQHRSGFCIVIPTPRFLQSPLPDRLLDPEGPLLVRFNRASCPTTHASDQVNHQLNRIMNTVRENEYDMGASIQIEIFHKQTTLDLHDTLSRIYTSSCGIDGEGIKLTQLDLGSDQDLLEAERLGSLKLAMTLADCRSVLLLKDEPTMQTDSGMTLDEDAPLLRYNVFMLLPSFDKTPYGKRAKDFSDTMASFLPGKSYSFYFHKSPYPLISSVLTAARSISSEDIGALRLNGRRQYPISRRPGARFNDPATYGYGTYDKFIVIVDWITPNEGSPSVLFLLTDRGQRNSNNADPDWGYSEPNFDHVGTVVWRYRDLGKAARRLAMEEDDELDERMGCRWYQMMGDIASS